MSAPAEDDWVEVGRIGRPHGVRGGLHIRLENPDSDLLRETLNVGLRMPDGSVSLHTVEEVYGTHLARFSGISHRDAADRYKHAELLVRRADFPPPAEDEAYLVDLIGARLVHQQGHDLGIIEGFDAGGPQLRAQIRRQPRGDLVEIPFVPGLVTAIDEVAGVVTVDPPWGLLEGEPEEAS